MRGDRGRYIVTGRCNATVQGYYVDAFWASTTNPNYLINTASNHDYFVSQRGFLWDLSPWPDEAPIDDPTQPLGTDLKTLQAILLAAYVPWCAHAPPLPCGFIRGGVVVRWWPMTLGGCGQVQPRRWQVHDHDRWLRAVGVQVCEQQARWSGD